MLRPEIERQAYVLDASRPEPYIMIPSILTFHRVFWAHSGLGVVTLPDFWQMLHSDRLSIIRDQVFETTDKTVHLKSGNTLSADYMVMCTGWRDHFGMFSHEDKSKIGIPHLPSADGPGVIDWDKYDDMADREVNEKLPFLANPPKLVFPTNLSAREQSKWRLYRRVVPLGRDGQQNRSLAILGQIHTVQTPLVSEVQSLWAILYLEGEIDLPDTDAMAREVSLWNAWTRKRYLGQGQKFPYSLYDFLPVRIVRWLFSWHMRLSVLTAGV